MVFVRRIKTPMAKDRQDEITIVNGFATKNLALKDGDEIYFIPKDRLPPKEALEAMMCCAIRRKSMKKSVPAGRHLRPWRTVPMPPST